MCELNGEYCECRTPTNDERRLTLTFFFLYIIIIIIMIVLYCNNCAPVCCVTAHRDNEMQVARKKKKKCKQKNRKVTMTATYKTTTNDCFLILIFLLVVCQRLYFRVASMQNSPSEEHKNKNTAICSHCQIWIFGLHNQEKNKKQQISSTKCCVVSVFGKKADFFVFSRTSSMEVETHKNWQIIITPPLCLVGHWICGCGYRWISAWFGGSAAI